MEKNVRNKLLSFLFLVVAIGAGGAVVYFGSPVGAMEQEGEQGPPPPMAVEFVTVAPEQVQIWKNFSGNVVAVDRAEIRPQVEGRITEIRFTDGQNVNKGDVLFVIDPRPYEAALTQAKAALESAKVQAQLAEKEYQRAKSLIKSDAISQSVMDERDNNRLASAAAVQGAQATVLRAEIDLDFAYVKAPISGRISRAEITEGNLVQKSPNAPLLTTIVAQDRVYVDFEVDERTYVDSIYQSKGEGDVPVRLKLSSANKEYAGTVHSFDNRIDPASGTIRARAIFDNRDGVLLPGMAVSVEMGGNGQDKQIMITERAIATDQDRKYVFVIGEGNAAIYREIKIGSSVSGKRLVLDGLKEGERVISSGLTHIRPGMVVNPQTQAEKDALALASEQKQAETKE